MTSSPQNVRVEQLTFTRFLAALAVVIFHFGGDVFPFQGETVNYFVARANNAVSYFFILSGFVMMLAYFRASSISFGIYLKMRLLRIYPMYMIAFCLALVYHLRYGDALQLDAVWLNLTLLQSWVPGKALSINSPGWSLSVEFFFYLLFPLLFNRLYRVFSFYKLLVVGLIFFAVSQIAFHLLLHGSWFRQPTVAWHEFAFYFPLMHLSEFVIGNIAGLFFLRYRPSGNFDGVLLLLFLAVLVALKLKIGVLYHNGMLAVFFVPMMVLLAGNTGVITRIFSWQPLVFLGEISYAMYILQMPICQWTERLLADAGSTERTQIFYLQLVVLLLAAVVGYRLVELPLRRKVREIQMRA